MKTVIQNKKEKDFNPIKKYYEMENKKKKARKERKRLKKHKRS